MIAHESEICSTPAWHRVLRLANRYPKQMNEALLLVDGARTRRNPDHPRLSIHALRGDPQWRGRRRERRQAVAKRA